MEGIILTCTSKNSTPHRHIHKILSVQVNLKEFKKYITENYNQTSRPPIPLTIDNVPLSSLACGAEGKIERDLDCQVNLKT